MSFIAGPYTVTLGGSSIGQTEEGVVIEGLYFGEPIRGDSLGRSTQDIVYLGGDVFANFILDEYDATSARAAFWPWSTLWGTVGQVGRVAAQQSIAAALVLTAVAGTPAATAPATLTANKAILVPDFPVSLLMASGHRKVPVRMQLLPFSDAGTNRWFILT